MAKGADKQQGKGGQKASKNASAQAEPFQKYTREAPPRLKRRYDEEVRAKLKDEFGFSSVMQVPKIEKITINMGLGRANQNPKILESAVEELRAISGQAPVVTAARRDIATFKLRRGHKIGVMVTLRRERMWEFLDRLISVALPRVRDFRGISPKAFDGRGNYSLGVREQIIFPEIEYDKIDSVKGLNITIVTSAKSDEEGRALLRHMGMPFRTPSSAAQGVAA
ncbi:50S ribosomal protein L5 [Haliangium ochraceum]|uniref:Large ribosomal subunit protein uL5 n=1 Tax=Haliangium ochraceum (strain DSM 14365 / JCM 11303 / SMP-2) TaxID=502025 RepID=D0LIB3_HALO1|nr:50S ribosomal protein L5 [Haliangium ochraceum]ACY16492.1 ribosomal protein L5 [Haliangium ochraceum DSM 14365]